VVRGKTYLACVQQGHSDQFRWYQRVVASWASVGEEAFGVVAVGSQVELHRVEKEGETRVAEDALVGCCCCVLNEAAEEKGTFENAVATVADSDRAQVSYFEEDTEYYLVQH
jgi:hypothetical protein